MGAERIGIEICLKMWYDLSNKLEFEGVHMMKRNKITALLYFITSLLFYVSAILNFTSDVGMGVIYLCLGSTSLCFGATWLNKNKKDDDNK